MWCPKCGSEYREGITRCAPCGEELVATFPGPSEEELNRGPLTGRPLEDELMATGPVLAGTFVTLEEAQAAVRTLSEADIVAEVVNRDEQFPMTIQKSEPGLGVAVRPSDLSQAQRILKATGLTLVTIARFRREEDAHAALARLEERGLAPRLSTLVLDEVPEEFRSDMDPYFLELPPDQEAAAFEALEGMVVGRCPECGAEVVFGDDRCRSCEEVIGA